MGDGKWVMDAGSWVMGHWSLVGLLVTSPWPPLLRGNSERRNNFKLLRRSPFGADCSEGVPAEQISNIKYQISKYFEFSITFLILLTIMLRYWEMIIC